MKTELEKLWYSYLIETVCERNDKEIEVIKQLSEKDNCLRDILNKEQISALEEYDNVLLKVSSISEKNSFLPSPSFGGDFFRSLREATLQFTVLVII